MSGVKDIKGNTVNVTALMGKVILVVNVASECGYTHQYTGLQELHEKYGSRGLVILAFPCNQFGAQEPGSPAEIVSFCTKNYGVTFPVMQKVDTNGKDAHAVFTVLNQGKEVEWNFEKWLVSKDGKGIARYISDITPEGMSADIEKRLTA
ncbi:MAG: hypothetical protein WDW36_009794 [Sanguina aurantia]